MKFSASILAIFATLKHGNAAGTGWNYDEQDKWPQVTYDDGTVNECGRENASGVGQSPIDVPATTCEENTDGIVLSPGTCTLADLTFTLNDHGIKASYGGDCIKPTAVLPNFPDLVFEAAQFHIHTGCEHRINGEGCDAELHIVHLSTDNIPNAPKAAVVGMMIDNTALEPHAGIDAILDCWSAAQNEFVATCNPETCDVSRRALDASATCSTGEFNVYDLIPEGSGYYYYMGGLTTPPCSEIVRWNLMDTKISVTLKQWSKIANAILGFGGTADGGECKMAHTVASVTGSTSRDTQDLLGREVTHRCNVIPQAAT